MSINRENLRIYLAKKERYFQYLKTTTKRSILHDLKFGDYHRIAEILYSISAITFTSGVICLSLHFIAIAKIGFGISLIGALLGFALRTISFLRKANRIIKWLVNLASIFMAPVSLLISWKIINIATDLPPETYTLSAAFIAIPVYLVAWSIAAILVCLIALILLIILLQIQSLLRINFIRPRNLLIDVMALVAIAIFATTGMAAIYQSQRPILNGVRWVIAKADYYQSAKFPSHNKMTNFHMHGDGVYSTAIFSDTGVVIELDSIQTVPKCSDTISNQNGKRPK